MLKWEEILYRSTKLPQEIEPEVAVSIQRSFRVTRCIENVVDPTETLVYDGGV